MSAPAVPPSLGLCSRDKVMVPSWSRCQQKPFGSRNWVVAVTPLDICPLPHVPPQLCTRAAQPAAPSPAQPTFSALQRPLWDNWGPRGSQKTPGEQASYKHSDVCFIFISITFPSLCEFFCSKSTADGLGTGSGFGARGTHPHSLRGSFEAKTTANRKNSLRTREATLVQEALPYRKPENWPPSSQPLFYRRGN